MRLRAAASLVFAAALFFWSSLAVGAAAQIAVRDDRGALVSLPAPAARIVTLSPHLTELAFAAGAGSHLVGVARYSDYPVAAQALPQVGDAARVDLERVVALRPDLVLAWKSGNSAADVARLEHLGYPVYVSDASRFADVARSIRTIGLLAGTSAVAARHAAAFEAGIARLRARYAHEPPLRVFYEIWNEPLLTVNGKQLISRVLALCGGRNVFAATPLLTPSISLEALIAARPQVIVGGSSAASPEGFAREWRRRRIAGLDRLPVFYVPPDFIQRATPRILEGAALICRDLQSVRAALGSRGTSHQ